MKRVELVQNLIKLVGEEFLESRGYLSVLKELREDLINDAVLDGYLNSNNTQTVVIDGSAVVVLGKNDEFINKEYNVTNTKTCFVANKKLELPEAEVLGMELLRKFALPLLPNLKAVVDKFEMDNVVVEEVTTTSSDDAFKLLDEIIASAPAGVIDEEKEVEVKQPELQGTQSTGVVTVDNVTIPAMFFNNDVSKEVRELPKGKTDITHLLKKNMEENKYDKILAEIKAASEIKDEPKKEEPISITVSSSGENKGFKSVFGRKDESVAKDSDEFVPTPIISKVFKKAPSISQPVKKPFNVGEAFFIENGILVDAKENEIPNTTQEAPANLIAVINEDVVIGDEVDENELAVAIKNSLDNIDFIENHSANVLRTLEDFIG